MRKSKIIFGIISSLPAIVFFPLWLLAKLDAMETQTGEWLPGLQYLMPAIWIGGTLSFAITIGGIIHIVREAIKGNNIGYFVLFTLIAASPMLYFLYLYLFFIV